MMCDETNSPTRPAASAPASTAARTLPTSPRTIVVTNAPPIWIVFTISTLAALHIAPPTLEGPPVPHVARPDPADRARRGPPPPLPFNPPKPIPKSSRRGHFPAVGGPFPPRPPPFRGSYPGGTITSSPAPATN